jgi:hypothetical protein
MKTSVHIYRPQDRLFEPFISHETDTPWEAVVKDFAKHLTAKVVRTALGGDDIRVSIINPAMFQVTTLTYKDGVLTATGEGQDIVEAMAR